MPPRHIDILQRLADGQNMIEIADELRVGHSYIKAETYKIRVELGADSTCQAVAMGLRRGFIN
jgi:DNA-binding NarL/FixJ family response regulator